MKHQRVNLVALLASEQPRPLITEAVDRLATSIREVGLIQPVTVRPRAVMSGGLSEPGFQIIAGHHRVAACRALGWTEIDAVVIDSAESLTDELIEIDENLCRSELTASQRSSYTKRRKQIWEALYPAEKAAAKLEVGEVCPPQEFSHGGARPQAKSFAAETAAITGESKRSINQHLARAEALGDDIDRLTGTSLDKGVELDALKAMPEPERKELIDRAVAGEVVTARAVPAPHPQPAGESPADFMQRFAFEMRLAIDSVKSQLGCATNADLAAKIAQGVAEARPDQLALLDGVLAELSLLVTAKGLAKLAVVFGEVAA